MHILYQPKTGGKLSISQIYSSRHHLTCVVNWKTSLGLNDWRSLTYVVHSYLHTSKILSVLLKLPLCEIFKLCLLGFQSTKNNCAIFGEIATRIQICHHKIPLLFKIIFHHKIHLLFENNLPSHDSLLFKIICHIWNHQDSIWGRNKYEKNRRILKFFYFHTLI
jgi:hypothetical protein